MKTISYLSFTIGVFLLIIEFIYKFNDLLGYLVTTAGILLSLFGLILNKTAREFIVNLILNFF